MSISQAGTFQSCAYKWQLEYQFGVRRRTQGVGPSALGSLVHLALAAALRKYWEFQNSKEWVADEAKMFYAKSAAADAIVLWNEENNPNMKSRVLVGDLELSFTEDDEKVAAWADMLDNARMVTFRIIDELNIPRNYEIVSVFHASDKDIIGEEVPLVEHWLELEVPGTNFVFRGIVDAVLRNRENGQLEVVDWKTRKAFTQVQEEQLNMQLGIYQYMLWHLYGLNVPLSTVYQVKSYLPKVTTNMDGTPNKRAANFEFSRPLTVVRNLEIQGRLWDNLVRHAHRIDDARRNPTDQPRAYGRACAWCTFNDLCLAELNGHDSAYLLNTMYEVRQEEVEGENEDG